MKNRVIISLGLIALAIAGCKRETEESPEGKTYEFFASVVQEGNTKVALQSDAKSFYWEPGDQIKVFHDGGGSGIFTADIEEPSASAVFKGTFDISPGEDAVFTAAYSKRPLSYTDGRINASILNRQTVSPGTFDRSACLFFARSGDRNLHFKNVCGGIKFSVSRDDIKSVTFVANGTDCYAGRATVSFPEDGQPSLAESAELRTVTVTPQGADVFMSGVFYYVSLLPTTLENGFGVILESENKGFGDYRSLSSREIKRSVVGVLANIDEHVASWESDVAEPQAVDMGLPSGTLWSAYNLGASKPEDPGFYYAWAESKQKYHFSWSDYKWGSEDGAPFSRYNYDSSQGTVDNRYHLLDEDDAAKVATGGTWRTPRAFEWRELIANCTWTATERNGVPGLEAASNLNGAVLFFPFPGAYDGDIIWNFNATGTYWTADLYENDPSKAYNSILDATRDSRFFMTTSFRRAGYSLRPVSGGTQGNPIPEAIDLGLPSGTKWASFNLGASRPEECGDYYCWGETSPKKDYLSWSNYKWCNNTYTALTKYCWYIGYWYDKDGTVDFKQYLDPEDDAVTATLGGEWHTPSEDEQKELADYCTWTWTGSGCLVTSNINGNSIFLPAAGYYNDDNNLIASGEEGGYLSSYADDLNGSYSRTRFDQTGLIPKYSYPRYYGLPVRPVYGAHISVTGVSISAGELFIRMGEWRGISATVQPAGAYNKCCTWSVDDESVIKYNDYRRTVDAVGEGVAHLTAKTIDGGYEAVCTVHVQDIPVPEAIDLGLPSGTKWSSFNLGASAPEEFGKYYAWGEIEPKLSYDWDTYKWCSGSYDSLTKYNSDSSYGAVDGKTSLDPEDDAAQVWLGNGWHTPTKAQIQELISCCTWTWTKVNGIDGYLVEGASNSIFLPSSGFKNGTKLFNASINGETELSGDYWSSELDGGNRYAFRLDHYHPLTIAMIRCDHQSRNIGQSIRPVKN